MTKQQPETKVSSQSRRTTPKTPANPPTWAEDPGRNPETIEEVKDEHH